VTLKGQTRDPNTLSAISRKRLEIIDSVPKDHGIYKLLPVEKSE